MIRRCRLFVRVHAFEEGSNFSVCGLRMTQAKVCSDEEWIDCAKCLKKLQEAA